MTNRSISQLSSKRLLGILMAMLMIAAFACSSGDKDSQDGSADGSTGDPVATGTSEAGITDLVSAEEKAEATADAQIEEAIGALFLEMTSPESSEMFVTQSSFEFTGRTSVDALLTVNDQVLEVDEQGRFALNVQLEEGPNVVEVVASNTNGEQFDEVLLVIYEPA